MSGWIFLGEQTEAGIVFQLGMNRSTGQYFRFEPLATKVRGNVLGTLRQEIENRSLVKEDQNQAINPVIGPIFYQERYWLGWKDRYGQNLFASGLRIKKPLREGLADLYPLIYSYCLWHQAGLIVGRPEWRRLSKDGNGVFMPDPKPLFYLAKPSYDPPIGLELCRPSEEFSNQPAGFSGDVFYLGLIIFYYLTGEVPFSLHKGWPNRNILNGTIVDPRIYRTDLPIDLGQMILSMLAPDPLKRPPSEMVKDLWKKRMNADGFTELNLNFKQKRSTYKQHQNLDMAVYRWTFTMILLIMLIAGLYYFYPVFAGYSKITPLKAADNFYQEMGEVNFRINQKDIDPSLVNDFILASKSRLKMIIALISKPLFVVKRISVVDETHEKAEVEADLVWWEWSGEGWARRTIRERLVFQKNGKKLILKRRKRLQQF